MELDRLKDAIRAAASTGADARLDPELAGVLFKFGGLERVHRNRWWLATQRTQFVVRGDVRTFRVHFEPGDEVTAELVREALSFSGTLRQSDQEHADYHIAILSSKTTQEWLDALLRSSPSLIGVVATSVRLPEGTEPLQRFQWVDLRARSDTSLVALALSLSMKQMGYIFPVVPEQLQRRVVPRWVSFEYGWRRIVATVCIASGLYTILAVLRSGSAIWPFSILPLATLSIGLYLQWQARRLVTWNERVPGLVGFWLLDQLAAGLSFVILFSLAVSGPDTTGALVVPCIALAVFFFNPLFSEVTDHLLWLFPPARWYFRRAMYAEWRLQHHDTWPDVLAWLPFRIRQDGPLALPVWPDLWHTCRMPLLIALQLALIAALT